MTETIKATEIDSSEVRAANIKNILTLFQQSLGLETRPSGKFPLDDLPLLP